MSSVVSVTYRLCLRALARPADFKATVHFWPRCPTVSSQQGIASISSATKNSRESLELLPLDTDNSATDSYSEKSILIAAATCGSSVGSSRSTCSKSIITSTTRTTRDCTTSALATGSSSSGNLRLGAKSVLLDWQPSGKDMPPLSNSLPNVVFVLGGPGAGKGTQCSKIVEEYRFVHLSAGDLLREERNRPGSEFGELIHKHIKDGTIVPVEITCSLIMRAMKNSDSNLFLIDGFPRSQNNLDGWEKEMGDKANVLFVLFFDAPEDVCIERCLARGQSGSGRADDNSDSLKKRVYTYMNDTMPIINHFMKKDLVKKVDASASPDEVFNEVKKIFDEALNG